MINTRQKFVLWFDKIEGLSVRKPHILVCPLDWGIGHATRCIPLIRLLLDKKVHVIIGADSRPLMLLRQEFPELPYIRFPGYQFSYPESSGMVIKMMVQAPTILRGIREEHKALEEIIDKYQIDAVISDNRFGLYCKKVPSIFITHQLSIQTPALLSFLKPILYRQNRKFISRFSACWIPDFNGDINLSGILSHKEKLPENYFFIGPQTRFRPNMNVNSKRQEFDLLAIISGPEPQRGILENILIRSFKGSGLKSAIVLGKPELQSQKEQDGNLTLFNHLGSDALEQLILNSRLIISRPGYSTLMDLAALGKKAIFIPTPGQTEQEYLGRHCMEQNLCYTMKQDEFDLAKGMKESSGYKGLELRPKPSLLEQRVDALINQISGHADV